MFALKKKIVEGKCAAVRCTKTPVENNLCPLHAEIAAREPENQLQELQAEHKELEAALLLVQEFSIATQDDVAFAEESRALTKGQWKTYESKRTKATKPFNEGLREVNSWFKPVQAALKAMEQEWNKKLKEFKVQQEQEQARLIEAAREAEEPAEIRETLIAAAEAPIQTTTTTFVDRWVFEVTDPKAVPREYLMPDEKKIGGVVAAMKDETNIPGVRAWNDPIVRGPSR
jgi:uncharacterized protein with gpF-like domain